MTVQVFDLISSMPIPILTVAIIAILPQLQSILRLQKLLQTFAGISTLNVQ